MIRSNLKTGGGNLEVITNSNLSSPNYSYTFTDDYDSVDIIFYGNYNAGGSYSPNNSTLYLNGVALDNNDYLYSSANSLCSVNIAHLENIKANDAISVGAPSGIAQINVAHLCVVGI